MPVTVDGSLVLRLSVIDRYRVSCMGRSVKFAEKTGKSSRFWWVWGGGLSGGGVQWHIWLYLSNFEWISWHSVPMSTTASVLWLDWLDLCCVHFIISPLRPSVSKHWPTKTLHSRNSEKQLLWQCFNGTAVSPDCFVVVLFWWEVWCSVWRSRCQLNLLWLAEKRGVSPRQKRHVMREACVLIP